MSTFRENGPIKCHIKIYYCLNQNTKILFSSNDFIKNLDIKLADLESRLNTVLPVEILNPADEEKMNLINFELQQRGLEINDKEMQYIFTHHSRDLNSLLNLAEKLDEISHQEKKSISIQTKCEQTNLFFDGSPSIITSHVSSSILSLTNDEKRRQLSQCLTEREECFVKNGIAVGIMVPRCGAYFSMSNGRDK